MLPIRKGDGTGLSVPGYSEVRKGDGTVLWSADGGGSGDIPDSAVAHYDASAEEYADDESVGTITDHLGAHDLTGGSATFVSDALNGMPAFRFGGDGHENSSLSLNQPDAFVTVVKPTSASTDSEYLIDGVDERQILAVNSGRSDIDAGVFAGTWVDSNMELDQEFVILSGIYDNTDSAFRVDETDEETGDAGTDDLDGFVLGELDADICEVIALSDPADVPDAEQYLKDKWFAATGGGTSIDETYATITPSADEPKDLSVIDDYAVIVGQGLSIVDISDPEDPSEVGTLSDTDIPNGYGVEATDDYAYVADLDGEFIVCDISDRTDPTREDSVSISKARKVFLNGDYAYVTTGADINEYHSIDISAPASPSIADTLTDTDMDYCFQSYVFGDYAYVMSRGTDLVVIIDVSDPTAMSKEGAFSDPDLVNPYGIDVNTADDVGYVTCSKNTHRLMTLDLSDPTSPSKLGQVTDSAELEHIYGIDFYGGEYVAVASKFGERVTHIDVSDASNPSILGGIDAGGDNYDVQVVGDYAFSAVRTTTDFVVSGAE